MAIALDVIGHLGLQVQMDAVIHAITVENIQRKSATQIVEVRHKGGTMCQGHS
jgi:hypothetical protein